MKIKNFNRLDGTTVRHDKFNDFDQVATLEITDVIQPKATRGGCGFKVGDQVELSVVEKHRYTLKENDVLKFAYKNVGDAQGSKISWDLR